MPRAWAQIALRAQPGPNRQNYNLTDSRHVTPHFIQNSQENKDLYMSRSAFVMGMYTASFCEPTSHPGGHSGLHICESSHNIFFIVIRVYSGIPKSSNQNCAP